MGIPAKHRVFLTLLAIVFAVGLTYAAIELPRAAHQALAKAFDFPGYDPGTNEELAEAYMRTNHIRAIGYTSMGLVVILIVAGLIAERRRLASAGALAFFLPVFGHFAVSMFFLASLGMLRIIWMPIVDVSTDLLRLGDIAYLPYVVTVYPPALAGVDIRGILPWVVMGLGMLIFALSVLAWFYAKLLKRGTADFWLYRFSRHPQYLGWIVWSYGFVILFAHHREFNMKITWDFPNSLPWVLATLVIIGVALVEEIRMKREQGEEYETYRQRVPFLFPMPRVVSAAIAAPMRFVLRRAWPDSGRQVLVTVGIYAVLLIVLSVPFAVFDWPPPRGGWWAFPYNIFPFQ
jgi:protein-S-isoprenylcysteine O-methyltransferase Ste14